MKPNIRSIAWYNTEYGEDWAEIVREEDIRLGRNSDGTYPSPSSADLRSMYNIPESWATHPINQQ